MKQIAIMISVPDVARADVMLTENRVYYRFATDDTLEDGDLPGLRERYLVVEARITDALAPREGEKPLGGAKFSVFVDNVRRDTSAVTSEGLARLVAELVSIDDVFGWLNGFTA